jgi:hypothetical protein
MSGKAPSDWEQGVLDAAAWLREHSRSATAVEMLEALSGKDSEGTEARTVKQIVTYLREVATQAGSDEEARAGALAAAKAIEDGWWKPK